ncbi:DUF5337 family protein [Maritimibacter sp. DP1N21-5]|uniref:DUF5337 family protein n=1 Tax=Maritimibacter sp. DP1N21-5 TaxID=2836867 RepID=UPI001C4502D5|nr:DUF5337 family protein [Maritimibacter sp. DP1N21-5]MBV7409450.1 DUF5337 domain-containing protein [Maritimibacter sp. DP1N21-5]
MTDDRDQTRARQGRTAAVVIALSGLVSIVGTGFGAQLGLSNRAMGLIGLAAMGGFAFGLILAVRIWLAGRKA